MAEQIRVGILLFNEVEVLDFAGPFEVFSNTTLTETSDKAFSVKTVSETGSLIEARNGLKVKPDYSFADSPGFDILIVPGGYGAEEIEINNPTMVRWLKEQQSVVKIMASVCTGAFLLAKAGILDGKAATTHWMDIDRLEREFPQIEVKRRTKFVDEGTLITAGGISAGINMSFHLIKRLLGVDTARTTAKRMEYDIEL